MRPIRAVALAALAASIAMPALARAQYEHPPPYGPYYRAPAQPWAGVEDVAAAAHRLSDRALQLYRAVRRVEGYTHLTASARMFAQAAERFHRTVEAHGGHALVREEFLRLQADYHRMRAAFFRAHRSHHVQAIVSDWTRMVDGMERLTLAMGVDDTQLCRVEPAYPPRAYRPPPRARRYRFRFGS